MMAVRTGLRASDLPDSLAGVRSAIEAAVPHGRTDNGGANDRGAWGNVPEVVSDIFGSNLHDGLKKIVEKYPVLERASEKAHKHLGTLGTGNHFIEVCLDEDQKVWVMLHSGSRGIGNAIGSRFIERAKDDMRRWFINLPDQDLAYIPEGSALFDDYVDAVSWAQRFAEANRGVMMGNALSALLGCLGRKAVVSEVAVNCHHNYIARENHFGANVWVT